MQVLDCTLPSAHENLALDEALLLQAEAGQSGELLRLWEHPRLAVVLGSGGIVQDDVNVENCCLDDVPILRRSSGGGTVLLGNGCLLFTVVLAYERSPLLQQIQSSYGYVLGFLLDALGDVAPNVERLGISDLAIQGKKISGNAQQRKRNYLLHHGSILYDFDVRLFERYLKHPPRQPDYRDDRAHNEFVRNVSCEVGELKRRICQAWQADEMSTTWPQEDVRRLVSEKYARQSWSRRR